LQDRTMSSAVILANAIKWTASAVVAIWITVPVAAQTLVIFMGVDFAAGLYVAIIGPGLSSRIAFAGLGKKIFSLAAVGLSHLISEVLHLPFSLGTLVATAYAVHEFISIAENFDKMGVWLPDVLLENLRKATINNSRDAAEIKALLLRQGQETKALDLKQSQRPEEK
jgi:toxin secretion/phage lysis holin